METIEYITSYLTPYLKGEVSIADDHIGIKLPNTILGLIPLGSQQRTLDVKHIVAVSSDFRVRIGQLILGLMLSPCLLSLPGILLGGPDALFGSLLGGVVGILGIIMALNALQTTVTISLASAQSIVLPIVIFEKDKAELIAQHINEVLAARTFDTNVRVHTDRSIADNQVQTDRIIEAIKTH